MAAFNFLNLSPTYLATVSEEIRTRRDILTAEAGFTDEFLWPNRKADIPTVKAAWTEKGITVSSDSVLKYDHGILRTTYLFLTGDDSVRAAILQKLGRKDPYCFAVGYFLKDGITSWEVVQQLAMEPVVITEEGVIEVITATPPQDQTETLTEEEPPDFFFNDTATTETPIFIIEPDEEDEEDTETTEVPSDVLLRMARDEFEHLKRGAALAFQLMERLTQRDAEREEYLESCEARIELLEEAIAGAKTFKDVPELQQLLSLTDKLAKEEEELEKRCEKLPNTSPHHGDKPVVYEDRFRDEFCNLSRPAATRVVKQLKALFNRGPDHNSLQTKRIWHEDLPGTPKGSWSCKAGSGGPHALRFTWQGTDTEITVFGLYLRNDLF